MFCFALGARHRRPARRRRRLPLAGHPLRVGPVAGRVLSHRDREPRLDGLRLAPADREPSSSARPSATRSLLWILAIVVTPVTIALYDVTVRGGFLKLAFVLLLGCFGISAPGTIYAAIASNARARDVLLPLLLFPVLIPSLLASVKATGLVLDGDPMSQLNDG